jgi:uncharacterized protein YggU (UPF0235/DUF167 family)
MYIKVRVVAGAKKESITKKNTTTYQISVREKAEGNRANTRIREVFASEYSIPIARVRIVSGHHSSSKILSIDEV